ncbi:MAG TPA: neuraminidase-like domain-containing protein, partial [Gammaproteobacteria bacterium]|nr:neuraminidase-like domain-containing protein [Gammaproteobacteria bacterium]
DEISKVIAILSKVNGDPDGSNTKAPFGDLSTLKVLDPYKTVLKDYLSAADVTALEMATDIPKRLTMYWAHIEKRLLPVLRETFVQQHLIAAFKVEADIVKLMLQETVILQTCLNVETAPANDKTYAEQYILMHRFTWLVGKLKLSGKELTHFENNPNFSNFNWKALDFKLWLRIADFAALRDSLPPAKSSLFPAESSLFPAESSLLSLFETAKKGGDITQAIVDVTAWDKINVAYFVAQHTSADFLNEITLINLQRKLALSEKIGVSIEELESWTTDSVSYEQSQDIKRTLKAKYSEDAWVEVSTAVHNRLRMHLRDALVAYLLQKSEIQKIGLKSANDLYAYFLIDVEMGACMLTSRLKQAIALVQLFVQRCLLNLEESNKMEESHKIPPELINKKHWEWMRLYRVWEANRKVFLYPENWIEPELRDNKSPFFKDLESELLQGELTDEIAEQKFMHYLEKLDEVSRLDICGIYEDHDAKEMHVFGRTFNTPPKYFYRKLDKKTQVWTAWEHVPLDIQGNEDGDSAGVHLMPVVWNRRLYLFWPIFTEKSDKEKIERDREPHKQWKKRKADSEAQSNRTKQLKSQESQNKARIQEKYDSKVKERKTENDKLVGYSGYAEGYSLEIAETQAKIEALDAEIDKLNEELNTFTIYVDMGFNEPEPFEDIDPWAYYEVRIAWSEYREHKWSNKKVSQSFIRTPSGRHGVPGTYDFRFSVVMGPILTIKLFARSLVSFARVGLSVVVGGFQLSCNVKVIPLFNMEGSSQLGFIKPKQATFYQSFLSARTNLGKTIRWNEDESLPLTLTGNQGKKTYEILYASEREYKVLFPADYNFSLGSPSDFIYQDHKRNYYVEYDENQHLFAKGGAIANAGKVSVDVPIPKIKLTAFPKITDRPDSLSRERLGGTDQLSYAAINKLVEEKQVTASTALQLHASQAFAKDINTSVTVGQSKASEAFINFGAYEITQVYPIEKRRELKFKPFFHAYVCKFMEELNQGGIDGLLQIQNQILSDIQKRDLGAGSSKIVNNFVMRYFPNVPNVKEPYPLEEVDFSAEGAYSLYNWELFFHVPMLIANRLSQNQRFEEARRWYHFIFNPTTNENLKLSARFWQVIPFRNTKQETLEALMMQLHRSAGDPVRKAFEDQITAWRDSPFNPHLIARMRQQAYMKNVVMKYLDNLIAWADSLFRQDTMESINEATQLYILAAEMVGKRPEKIPSRVKNIALNYAELEKGLDKFSNALVQLETLFPFYNIQPIPPGSPGVGPILNNTAPSLYFCLPNNE